MTTYKITDARNKRHIGKTFTVENGQTVFNKKAYEFKTTIFEPNDDGSYRTPLYHLSLITERATSDVHIKIIEIK